MDELQNDVVEIVEQLSKRLQLPARQLRVELHIDGGKLRRADVHLVALKPEDLRRIVGQ